jgi:Na+-transporting NADH:ubiquinone oxidoreductase subunit B
MRRVLLSLSPIFLFSFYLYGLRFAAIVAVVFPLGILVEYFFEKSRGKKPSEAVLITCALYALSMPPIVPLWIVAVGILFAVFMAKEVYGGFGRNVFNPAIAGRLFVYISFATAMQSGFIKVGSFGTQTGWPGSSLDAVTGATPLALMRGGQSVPLVDLALGFHAGSIGESSALLIALAGIYLIATKTASWRLIVSTIASGSILTYALAAAGIAKALPLESLLAGSFLFVAVFMVTDPVSAPKKPLAQWLYGSVVGICIILIRTFSVFPEGTSFAVLLGNTAASLLDEMVTKKKPKTAGTPAGAVAADSKGAAK